MFVSSGQIFAFIYCISFGVVMGLLYFPISLLKRKVKKIFSIIFDIVFFILLSFVFMMFLVKFNMPNFRFYMIFGVVVGFFIENKTFNFAIAKLLNMLYYIRRKGKKL